MTNHRKGEFYAFTLSILESFFPILTLFILQSIGPLFAYALCITVATIAFAIMISYEGSWSEFKNRAAYKDLLLTTLYITTLFLLIVIGLQYTTAGNMAVIITLQLFFSYLYFNVCGDEKMGGRQTLGAFLMGIGAIIILFPDDFTLNWGDLLILLAAIISPIANIYQKRARTQVSSKTILVFRNIVALPIVLIVALCFEDVPSVTQIGSVWWFIVLNGLLVFTLSKVLWIEALHLISITKLSALISFMPIFTLIFAYMFLNELPNSRQLLGIIPVVIGSYLITRVIKA